MIGALILSLIPTIFAGVLIGKTGIKLKSGYLKLALYWFTGQYLFTIIVFLAALGLSYFTSGVLLKASIFSLIMLMLALIFLRKNVLHLKEYVLLKIKIRINKADLFIIIFCFLFSYLFFIPHLKYQNEAIYRSPIYWDYHWQMSLIQNFAYGDNFPPENEAFAGIPANYHYFWMVNASIYQTLGLNLVDTINITSIIQFFVLLIALIGLGVEFFKSRLAGFIAVFLTVTSSTLHFIDYFYKYQGNSISSTILSILGNNMHPWDVSQITMNPFGYHGTMYNMFYFLQERQMIMGVVYLLICLFLISKRKQLSQKTLLIVGFIMGGYFLWHLHITIMVLCSLLFVLAIDKDRKKTLIILCGFISVFLLHYLYFKGITQSEWFLKEINNFPKLNFNYSSIDGKPISLSDSIYWYIYSYGLKVIAFFIGIGVIFRENKKLAILIASIVIPSFVIINTLQLTPGFIHENHKFLRPMNIIVDLIAAYAVYKFITGKKVYLYSLGPLFLILLTLSGFIELMPFLNSKPTQFVANYPTSLTSGIRMNTPPKSIFVGKSDFDIYLAGRKLFLASELRGHDKVSLKKDERREIIKAVYDTPSRESLCTITKKYEIDYIEIKNSQNVSDHLNKLPHFSAVNSKKEQVRFVDVGKSCTD